MTEKRPVNIDLLGVRLTIKTTQTPTEVEQVVALLRSRIEGIQKASGAVDSLRVAVLAALDISRELVEARRELDDLRDLTAERTLALVERLEAETAVETLSEADLMPPVKKAALF